MALQIASIHSTSCLWFYRFIDFDSWVLFSVLLLINSALSEAAVEGAARITLTPLDSVVELNKKISLFCRVAGNPMPSVIWKKNGKPIAQPRYVIETVSTGLSTLRIEPVREKDNQSQISCHIDDFSNSTAAFLTVLNSTDLPNGFPQILEEPKLRAVEKNHSATMTCSVKGRPFPRVLWLKDLLPVNMNNSRYSVATLGNPGSLVIQNSEEMDEGKYECVARNEKGVVHSRSAHLYVKVRRVPPQFSIPPRRVYHVMPQGRVEMNCVAYGHPMPRVFWRRSSTNEDLQEPSTAPVGKNVLVLENVTRSENFSCVAFSLLGNINAEVSVEVKALPDPPDILRVTNVSAKSVSLSWAFSQPERLGDENFNRRYVIKYKPKYSDGGEFSDGETSTALNSTVSGLEPYTEYELRVHTVVDIGRSKASKPVYATTSESLPESPPKNVQSRPLSATNILVQWEAPDKPNGRISAYKVYYNYKETEPYSQWPFKEISEGRMAQVNELMPNKLYSIRVQAKNSIGYGPVSDTVLVYTKTGIPGQPVNVRATAIGSNDILINWDPPLHPDVRFYLIRYNWTVAGKAVQETAEVEVPGSVNERKITRLKPNTDYTFYVVAKSLRGEGAPSRPATVRTGASVPNGPPEGVFVESLTSTSVRVLWEPPANAAAYGANAVTVYRISVSPKFSLRNASGLPKIPPYSPQTAIVQSLRDDDDNDDAYDAFIGATAPSYHDLLNTSSVPLSTDIGSVIPLTDLPYSRSIVRSANEQRSLVVDALKPYTVYRVTVAAGTAAGYGPESQPPTEIRTQADVPGPPRDVQATVLNETCAKLVWDEPLDKNGPVSGYFVDLDELNEENQFVLSKPIRNFMAGKEKLLNNLKPNTKYSARVSAYNSKGDGVVSKAKIFRTMPLRPMPPKNVRVELKEMPNSESKGAYQNSDPIKAKVSWDAPENLQHATQLYMLKYKLKEDAKFTEVPVQNLTWIEIDDLKSGRTYEFRVMALYDGQYSEEGWNAITTPVGMPSAAPSGVRYEYSLNDRTLQFTWDEIPLEHRNGEITRYQIVLEGGLTGTVTREVNENKASYQGISPSSKYTFNVRAGTINGFGPWSNWTVVEPSSPDQFLIEIVELTAMSESEAGIKWTPLSSWKVQGYRIRFTREASADSWQHVDVRNRSMDHAFVDKLERRATYQFCVQALIDDKKISECASHRSLELRPIFVVKNLEFEIIEPKVARLSWSYDGPEPAVFRVYYDLSKEYRMENGQWRSIYYTVPVQNVSETLIDVTGLRVYTNYTFKVSVVYNNRVYLPQRRFMTTGVDRPPDFEPLIVVEASKNDVKVKLHAAADENGPVLLYWVVVAPSNYSKLNTDSIENSELQSEQDIYIALELTQDQLWSSTDHTVTIGNGQVSNGMFGGTYHNRPLVPNRPYKAFVRAFVGAPGGKLDINYKSCPWSAEFGLIGPPSNLFASTTLWIFAPLAFLVVVGIIVGGICLFLLSMRRKKIKLERNNLAKISLNALNGPNETSKLLGSNHYGSMPPPINGNVKPYETSPAEGIYGFCRRADTDLSNDPNLLMRIPDRPSTHYPVPQGTGFRQTSSSHQPIPVVDFASHLERLKENDNLLFSQEYESIETDQHFTWEHSSKETNKSKNRYANVIAYDHSRVVLTALELPNLPCSDYINANYIDGYRKPKAYIATQGPLPETFGDFWRMIWEQNSSSIVMLTKLEERTRIKCDQYWPSRSSQTYGVIQVAAKDTIEFAHYTLRIFEIFRAGCNESREVKHLQFTAWPDHGVPDHPTPFLMFLRRVKALNPPESGPIVVHCSAGVGRTGAFIVIDCMLERLRYESTLDVYGCVTALRSQRNYMVQTEEQYIFIHDAVLDAAQSGCTEVAVNRLFAHIQQLTLADPIDNVTGMEAEFRLLSTVKLSNARYTAATLPCNKHKNRLVNILPFDSTRVLLWPLSGQPDGCDYINASLVDGYRRRNAYIATQGPLATTVDDFWRMLWEHDSSIIVMLTKLHEMGREKCYQYWPSDRSERYGALTVEPIAEYNMPQYILREFKLTDTKDGQSRTVRHFQYTEWPEQGVPKSGEYFIEFIGQVHKTKEQFGLEGPITVHCSAGVGRTGVFVCLSIVLERMRYEGVVDIFTIVKLLRTQRANMVQSEDQYQFCYRASLEYLGSFDHYALQSYE